MIGATRTSMRLSWWVAVLAFSGIACGDGSGPEPAPSENSVASVEITPSSASLAEHSSLSLTATTRDAEGHVTTPRTVQWRSVAVGVVSVLPLGGNAYGVAPGQGQVIAEVEGHADTATITVTPIPVASVALASPLGDTVLLRSAGQLTATPLDADGVAMTRTVTWSTNAPAVATVTADGLVQTLSTGTGSISATVEDKSATLGFLVETATFTAISAGVDHDCAIASDGQLWCWGSGAQGQLGRGDRKDQDTPSPVGGSLRFSQVTTGQAHTCGLSTDGHAYCWGRNDAGELGTGSTTDQLLPVQVAGGHTFTSVSAGWGFTCGVDDAAIGFCWGDGSDGRLGAGAPFDASPLPERAIAETTFVMMQAGTRNACGITTQAQAVCWGDNSFLQLGTALGVGGIGPVPGLTLSTLSVGKYHVCGLTPTGEGQCWGQALFGALGDAGADEFGGPRPVAGRLAFTQLAAGEEFTCGLSTAGTIYCWGNGGTGTLGNGNEGIVRSPSPTASTETFAAVSARGTHACGLTVDGVIYCWGTRYSVIANLGDGLHTISLLPVRLPGT